MSPGNLPQHSEQSETETITEWGVADERGWFYGVTPCESEEAARQHQAISGGELVCRVTYATIWDLTSQGKQEVSVKTRELPNADELLAVALTFAQLNHDDHIARNRAIFLELPPYDCGVYVYTYYNGNGYALYHGYTTNARQRAGEHLKRAPWASWAEGVRYRKCTSPQLARKLESRLHKKG